MVRLHQKLVLILACFIVCQHAFAQATQFAKADSVAELYAGHSLKDLQVLSHKLTDPLSSDLEKFRSIYKWVCLNIDNDYALAQVNLANRKNLDGEALDTWNRSFSAKAMRILLNDHRAVCTGYAWLVSQLARYSGITCRIVDGYGRSSGSTGDDVGFPNHSWNAVLLDNRWYLCDPTWSSGAVNTTTGDFIQNFEESYFLTDPELFVRNHFPLDTAWTLLNDPPSLETFRKSPVVYVNSFRNNIMPVLPSSYNVVVSKGEKVSFVFEGEGEGWIVCMIGSSLRTGAMKAAREVMIEQRFKQRGTFPVHFLLDYKFIASYEVTVR